jgi:TonB-dependent receptor
LLLSDLSLRRSIPLPLALLAVAACSTMAHAQGDPGSIAGTVTEGSNAVLQGAKVTLQPGGQTAVTNQQGMFIIPGLPQGPYTVTVSYLGFENYTTQTQVVAGAIASVNPVLTIENATSSVTVRPEREVGEAEALNRQQNAINIVQVLPSEVINSLPNVNIADAVGRLPGVSLERDEGEGKYVQIRGTEPRLNNVTIDGINVPSPENVRNVKLDTIPADLVESIELNKTLTANMDADGIGGSVNLVTRTATDQPYFAVEGLLGHTPIGGGRGMDEVFATYGKRFLADKKLGFLFTGSYDWNGRGINDVEPSEGVNPILDTQGNPTGKTFNGVNETDLRDYYYDRSRYGLGGTLDYKLSQESSAYLKGLYSYFDDFGEDGIYALQTGNFISPTTSDASGSVQYSDNYRRPVQQIWSLLGGAHQEHGQNTINYRAALSQAALTGGSTQTTFSNASPVAYNLNDTNPHTPKLMVSNGVNIFDPTQFVLNNISIQNQRTFERDLVGELNFAHRYVASGSAFGVWEAGVKVRDVIKGQHYTDITATQPFGDPLQLSSVLSGHTDPNYYFNQYQFGPQAQATKILGYYQQNIGEFTYDPDVAFARNLPNDWHVNERTYAGFLMNTLTYGRYRINTGVRIEATLENVKGNLLIQTLDANGTALLNANGNPVHTTQPTKQNTNYIYALPSIQGEYSFNDYTDIRLAYSIGLARPNYGDLAPYQLYDPTANQNQQLSAGNPNLKPTYAHNLDLLGEHYLHNVGVIQGGVFYKMLYNYIATTEATVQFNAPGSSGPAPFVETTPTNIGAAHIVGMEASWEQHLTMLPGALSGTGFRANYSYTASVAGIPGRSDHPSLQRNAPNNYNVDLTYDKYNLSARMGLTHNDAYLWAYQYQDGTPIAGVPTTPTPGGSHGPGADTYIFPHTQVDAQVSYRVPRGRGVSVVAQFLNLNNEVFGFYNGSQQFPIQREYYSPTYTFGLRWTQNSEHGSVFHQ